MLVNVVLFLSLSSFVLGDYKPTWDSLDSRPLPEWYDQSKIGIFLHWGVYSVPSFRSEWFWSYWQQSKSPDVVKFMEENYKPGFAYQNFASEFTAEFYDPDQWADIFAASGAKYIVLTSKHHEGYTMWPSNVSWNWNAKDIGPRRDLLGDLATAIRKKGGMHFGLYHSLFEWFNPLYLMDQKQKFNTSYFVDTKTMPELIELVMTYQPEVIWSDGDAGPDTYWKSKEFLAWLYNKSPVKDYVVVNDRWGDSIPCHHGGFYTCSDRFNPKTHQKHKWENAMTVDKSSWGYRRNAKLEDFLTVKELITTLAETVSCNGNLLINVGPTHDGRIAPIFEERLRQLGSWLSVNGEAIYESKPWTFQNDSVTPGVWFTSKEDFVYAIVLNWPQNNILTVGVLQLGLPAHSNIYMLGIQEPLAWAKDPNNLTFINFPPLTPATAPSQWAWVLKIAKT